MKYKHLLWILILFGCENGQHSISDDWNGTEADFEDSFKVLETHDFKTDSSLLLVDKKSGNSFTGNLERSGIKQSTKQNYSNGLLHGKSIKSSSDGSWVEAHYLRGKLHGNMIFYDAKI